MAIEVEKSKTRVKAPALIDALQGELEALAVMAGSELGLRRDEIAIKVWVVPEWYCCLLRRSSMAVSLVDAFVMVTRRPRMILAGEAQGLVARTFRQWPLGHSLIGEAAVHQSDESLFVADHAVEITSNDLRRLRLIGRHRLGTRRDLRALRRSYSYALAIRLTIDGVKHLGSAPISVPFGCLTLSLAVTVRPNRMELKTLGDLLVQMAPYLSKVITDSGYTCKA